MPQAHSKFLGAVVRACLCVKVLRALDTFSPQVLSTTSNFNNTFLCHILQVVGQLPDLILIDLTQDMKLG
jgi:hypothetical protein